MVILSAQIYLFQPDSNLRYCYFNRFISGIIMDKMPYLCTFSMNTEENFPEEKWIMVEMEFSEGEWSLMNLLKATSFDITMGKIILGKGKIKKILKVHFEKKNIERWRNTDYFKNHLRKVLDVSSELDNVIIEEGVTEMLDE